MTVLRNILIRLLTTAVTLFGVAVIVFVVIRVVPGNPIAMMLPPVRPMQTLRDYRHNTGSTNPFSSNS
ncbi:hypothetical protein ACFQDZ_21280 [Sulfitobacter pacificus]|uniref:hypothetical protein n=1 Tax=Sulfitobacter pacificus TaxID=1499314 RepID=UPI00360E981D